MPAPSLSDLFNYDFWIETAWQKILEAEGLPTFIEFSDEKKESPYIDIQLTDVQPNGFIHIHQGKQYMAGWKGVLTSKVVTMRGKNSDQHREMLGRVRMQGMRYDPLFTMDILPFHAVRSLKESQLTRGTDPNTFLDWSELRHELEFFIADNAWPV